jgi:hypothetical protein
MYLKLFLEVANLVLGFVVQSTFSFLFGSRVLTSRLSCFIVVLAPKGRS